MRWRKYIYQTVLYLFDTSRKTSTILKYSSSLLPFNIKVGSRYKFIYLFKQISWWGWGFYTPEKSMCGNAETINGED